MPYSPDVWVSSMFNVQGNLLLVKGDSLLRYDGNIDQLTYLGSMPQPSYTIERAFHNDSLLFVQDFAKKVWFTHYEALLPTRIKDNVNRSIAVRMYPNPAREAVTLELPANVNQAQISVLDVLGKEHLQISSTEQKVQLSLRGLSTGVYFVRIQTPQGSSTKRLLVQE
jgi:hypothetical protein